VTLTKTLLVLCGLWGSLALAADRPDRIGSVEVDGTVLRIARSGGKTLSGADLVGLTVTLTPAGDAAVRKVFVEAAKIDPRDPAHEILLYHFLSVDPATGQREELCGPDAYGERWGFPLRGQWDPEGQHISDAGFTLTCADGAQGKCVRFGYKPWKTLGNGLRLADYHQACVRMVRADYCGGHGTTRDGMLIDLYDDIGIQDPDPQADAAGVRFEAAWSPAGAVCVAHTRVPEHVTLQQLAQNCPRLKDRLGPEVCTAAQAKLFIPKALLYNKSR
jgi:hypothetical protein